MPRIRRLEPDSTLILPEAAARRLVLAQAVEAVDTQGRLVSPVEREQIESQALQATGDPARGEPLDRRAYLQARAQRLLAAAENRNPRLAALHHPSPWLRAASWGLPLAALLLLASAGIVSFAIRRT